MSSQIVLRVGKEYDGPRHFALVPSTDKSEPPILTTTPKLAIPMGALEKSYEGFQDPKRLLMHTADTVAIKDLERAQPTTQTPWGIEVKLRTSGEGFIISSPNGTTTRGLELGALGYKHIEEATWIVDGYVFDEGRRHRCEILMSNPKVIVPFDAVGFVKKHYHKQLDPAPLKP